MYFLVLMYLVCFTGGVLSNSLIAPCKMSDITCIKKSVNTALPQIFDGIPELGVESSDPQFNDVIDIIHQRFHLSLLNSTLIGYKKCAISNLKFNDDFTTINCIAECRGFELSGKYKMKGRLLRMPVEGEGDFEFNTGIFVVNIDTEVKKVKGGDGKIHLAIKGFEVEAKPITPIKYVFHNLFDGQKDLSDDINKYINENWEDVAELFQYPIWYKSMNTIGRNVNKYLDYVAFEKMLL